MNKSGDVFPNMPLDLDRPASRPPERQFISGLGNALAGRKQQGERYRNTAGYPVEAPAALTGTVWHGDGMTTAHVLQRNTWLHPDIFTERLMYMARKVVERCGSPTLCHCNMAAKPPMIIPNTKTVNSRLYGFSLPSTGVQFNPSMSRTRKATHRIRFRNGF